MLCHYDPKADLDTLIARLSASDEITNSFTLKWHAVPTLVGCVKMRVYAYPEAKHYGDFVAIYGEETVNENKPLQRLKIIGDAPYVDISEPVTPANLLKACCACGCLGCLCLLMGQQDEQITIDFLKKAEQWVKKCKQEIAQRALMNGPRFVAAPPQPQPHHFPALDNSPHQVTEATGLLYQNP